LNLGSLRGGSQHLRSVLAVPLASI